MEQIELLRYLVEVLEDLSIPYMLVGSYASSTYGEARMTQDIDVVIDMSPGQVRPFCERFALPEFYVSPEAVARAVRTRRQFNVIHPESANKIDFMLAGTDEWAAGQLSRRRRVAILPGRDVAMARPEDVIIGKMLYYREGGSEKHLRDITGILKLSGPMIDRAYIMGWADKLGVADVWKGVQRRMAMDESEPG